MTREELMEFSEEELKALLFQRQEECQSGVAFTYQADLQSKGFSPAIASEFKHLRVGIDAALVNDFAIANLLMDKGIITSKEYLASCVLAFEREQQRLLADLQRRYPGMTFTLGRAGSL